MNDCRTCVARGGAVVAACPGAVIECHSIVGSACHRRVTRARAATRGIPGVSTSWFKSLVDRFSGNNADPAAAARAAQVRAFRAAVVRDLRDDPSPEDRAALEALLRVPEEQGLPGDEVELET